MNLAGSLFSWLYILVVDDAMHVNSKTSWYFVLHREMNKLDAIALLIFSMQWLVLILKARLSSTLYFMHTTPWAYNCYLETNYELKKCIALKSLSMYHYHLL